MAHFLHFQVSGFEKIARNYRRPSDPNSLSWCHPLWLATIRGLCWLSCEEDSLAWPDRAVDACHHCQQKVSVTAVVLGHVCLVVKHHNTSRYQDPTTAHCLAHFPMCNVESPLTLNPRFGCQGERKTSNSYETLERDNRALKAVCACPGLCSGCVPKHRARSKGPPSPVWIPESGSLIFLTL